ncbi:MAG: hypothetical protein ABIT91_08240 [Gemmatimonadaceae bacterium]
MNDAVTRTTSDIPATGNEAGEVTVPWFLVVLLRARRLILGIVAVGVLLGVVLALLKPDAYTCSFSFLPQAAESQGGSGLASLAGQLGISVGGLGGNGQPPQLYADLFSTRSVLAPIAKDSVRLTPNGPWTPLHTFLEVKEREPEARLERTIKALRTDVVTTSVATHTTGIIAVSVRTTSPYASLQIAQHLLDGVNRFNIATRKSQAAEERRFTEGRLQDAKASLRVAEDALQRFLQGNRQFSGSPELRFQQERLQREVSLQQQVVVGLAQQYEDARIREVRDTPVITVIEPPVLPVFRDPKGRVMTVITYTFLAAFAALAFVVIREGWRLQRDRSGDPTYSVLATEWSRTKRLFSRST